MSISLLSGAYPLTPQETDYIVQSYQQIIDMAGLPVLYKIQQIVGEDEYEHPIINYIKKTIQGVVTNLYEDEYQYVEPGFLPTHYANLYVYDAVPQVGDHVVWEGIEWEVRGSYPAVIGDRTIYYQVIIRRVLGTGGTSGGAGGDTSGGSDGGNTGGTLGSGGTGTLLPLGENDP
jgi:hypothetical protein